MRVIKPFAMAAIVLAAGQAWAQGGQDPNVTPSNPYDANSPTVQQVSYDYNTGYLELQQTQANVGVPPGGTRNNPIPGVAGMFGVQIYTAGTTAANNPPNPALYGTSVLPYIGADWNYYAVQEPTQPTDMFWQKPSLGNVGVDGLAAGTYLLAVLSPGLTAQDFGNATSSSYGPGNTTGSVLYVNDSGVSTFSNVTLYDEPTTVPEPSTLLGLFSGGIVGLVGFAGRRYRKVVV
jgi:hypothetical protein